MAQFQNMIITRAGLDMIAQSQAGGTLIFTKGKLGDGQIGDQSIPDLTDLINAKMSVELSSVTAKTEGHVEVRFIVDNTDLDVGFFVREVGIYAKINNEGVEQLYGYANAGNYTNYLADKSVPIDSIITKIDLVVGNASNIAFTTDKSIVYVTLEDLEEAIDTHNKDSNAHEPAFAAHNADGNAHKDMVGATSGVAGKRGMVPAPAAGDQNKALFGDATYKQVVQKVNGVAPNSGGNVNVDMSGYLPLTGGTISGALTVNNTVTANKFSGDGIVPIGTILPFAGGTIPEGFLACEGAGLSTATYSGLYAVIGNTYGGDTTTFNLPNLTNRFLQGSNTVGTVKAPGLPNITGSFPVTEGFDTPSAGALYSDGRMITGASGLDNNGTILRIDASRVNTIYGASDTVQPPAVTVRFIIKY